MSSHEIPKHPEAPISQEDIANYEELLRVAEQNQDTYFKDLTFRNAIKDQIKLNYKDMGPGEMEDMLNKFGIASSETKRHEEAVANSKMKMKPEDAERFRRREQQFADGQPIDRIRDIK